MNHFEILGGMTPRKTTSSTRLIPYQDLFITATQSWAHIQTKLYSKKIRATFVHSSSIHNSQDMEAT